MMAATCEAYLGNFQADTNVWQKPICHTVLLRGLETNRELPV
jgi:hypothetical protein